MKITLAHGPNGYAVQAFVTGFDPDDEDEMRLVEQLDEAIKERTRVLVFDGSIEVAHIFEPDATTEETR